MAESTQPSLSTIGVLREAFKTTRTNGKLVASILLLVFLSSSQLELGSELALKAMENVISDRLSSSFEARGASSFQWANQQTFTQTGSGQRLRSARPDNSSSYGYMGRSMPVGEARGVRSSQRANSGSYGTYLDQRVLRSSQKANPAGTYYYMGHSMPIEEVRDIRSSQRVNHDSYGYVDQSMRMREVGGVRSYRANRGSYGTYLDQRVPRSSQQANPGSYEYVTPIEEVRDIRSSQRPNHGSYGHVDQSMRMREVRGIRSSQQATPGSYSSVGKSIPRVNDKVTHSAQRANPGSYSYMDQLIPLVEDVVRAYLGMELLALTVSCIILLFFLVAITSSSYEAHTAKVMSLKDVFLKFRESWKRPIHTSFCLTLISLGLFVLLVIFAVLIQILAEGSTAYILYAILIVSSSFTYLHMAARWMLSLVVSVLESDASGLKAIDRAGELTKGKRIQASILMILFHLAMVAVHMASNAMTKTLDGWAKMAITIPFTIGLICVLKLFMFAVYTVYYHDRKMSRKEEGANGQVGLYVPIASDEA